MGNCRSAGRLHSIHHRLAGQAGYSASLKRCREAARHSVRLFKQSPEHHDGRGSCLALLGSDGIAGGSAAGAQSGDLIVQPASSRLSSSSAAGDLFQFLACMLKAKHYIRYVDDFVLLHESPQQLNDWLRQIEDFLPSLGVRLNPSKTILQPIDRGVDFVGHVINPWRRTTRKKSVAQAMKRTAAVPAENLLETANSYFGLLGQASHSLKDRAALANLVLRRGHAVNSALTQTYRKR